MPKTVIGDRIKITNIPGDCNQCLVGREAKVTSTDGPFIRAEFDNGGFAYLREHELEVIDRLRPVLPADWADLPDSVNKWIHDLESETDPAGTLRELRQAQASIRAQEKLIEELKVRSSIEFVHPLYLKGLLMRLEPEMECERDWKTIQRVLRADIEEMDKRLKGEGQWEK